MSVTDNVFGYRSKVPIIRVNVPKPAAYNDGINFKRQHKYDARFRTFPLTKNHIFVYEKYLHDGNPHQGNKIFYNF